MEFNDRVALVTGSGRGIGRAIALKLASRGAVIVVNDFGDEKPAQAVADEIVAAGGKASVMLADVSNSGAVNAMIDSVKKQYGRLDILVNNAGIARDRLLLRMTDEEWQQVIEVNLYSVFKCTRAAVKLMSRQRYGRIINIASVSGLVGNPGQANYAASKAGIIGFTRTVAREMASRGITANIIAPGLIDTGLAHDLTDEQRAGLMAHIPLGMLGQPEDIAASVAFLASDDARYITGQILNVDGGMVLSW
jgi:3-oxoacyl-[acyl-carrier protein] reductase